MTPKETDLSPSEPHPGGQMNNSFWADDIDLAVQSQALLVPTLPKQTGVLIVGAGYTGLSAALTLARAGQDVTVIDTGGIGFGCSSRNGGHIGPSFHKLGSAGLAAEHGQDLADAVMRESLDALNWLKAFIKDEDIDCDLQLVGRFKGASRPHHYDEIARSTEKIAAITGLIYEMVPADQQHKYTGSPKYFGGVLFHEDGLLHPAKFVLGMAQKVVAAGGRIVTPAKADKIQRTASGFLATVGKHQISADQVLIATNGYTGPEFPYHRSRVIPIRSAVIVTEDLGQETVSACFPKGRGVIETSRLVLYPRPTPDGKRIMFGGRAFNTADRPDRYVPDLKHQMALMFPDMKPPEVTHSWSGTVAYPFDHAPHLGCHDGMHFAMGYCGSGVGRASFFGRKIALQMLGDPNGKTTLDNLPFSTRPLYNGNAWFLPAVLGWHRMMDMLGR